MPEETDLFARLSNKVDSLEKGLGKLGDDLVEVQKEIANDHDKKLVDVQSKVNDIEKSILSVGQTVKSEINSRLKGLEDDVASIESTHEAVRDDLRNRVERLGTTATENKTRARILNTLLAGIGLAILVQIVSFFWTDARRNKTLEEHGRQLAVVVGLDGEGGKLKEIETELSKKATTKGLEEFGIDTAAKLDGFKTTTEMLIADAEAQIKSIKDVQDDLSEKVKPLADLGKQVGKNGESIAAVEAKLATLNSNVKQTNESVAKLATKEQLKEQENRIALMSEKVALMSKLAGDRLTVSRLRLNAEAFEGPVKRNGQHWWELKKDQQIDLSNYGFRASVAEVFLVQTEPPRVESDSQALLLRPRLSQDGNSLQIAFSGPFDQIKFVVINVNLTGETSE